MLRRPTARVVLAAALLPAALTTGTAEAARPKTQLSVQPPTTLTAGTTLTITGSLTPLARRTVQLQAQRTAGVWTNLATATSARRTGRFTLRTTKLRTPGTVVLRVRARRTTRARTGVSSTFTITVTAPGSTPTTPPAQTPTPGPTPTPIPTTSATRNAFRILSVTAADQSADPAHPAAIRNTVSAAEGWFATQTTGGVRPRWQRDAAGAVSVQLVQLPSPLTTYAPMSFSQLRAAIEAAAPTPSGQKTLAFFNVNATGACGTTGGGMSLITEATCDIHPSPTLGWPYGASYLVAHELTHNFGAVPSCAPHAGGGGHVLDDPRDVLYAGAAARDWNNITLDPGHDDYYATGNAACPGIEASPFWTATSDPLS